ncbi:MAG: hypothetical protein ACLFN8_01200 [Candidatus Woesearchaeota archaeon]
MDAWSCESCGAIIKQSNKPQKCMLCNRRSNFTHINLDDKKDESSEKYEEALKKLEEYEEGTPKRKLTDYTCSCTNK